jgi:hypothetical protein
MRARAVAMTLWAMQPHWKNLIAGATDNVKSYFMKAQTLTSSLSLILGRITGQHEAPSPSTLDEDTYSGAGSAIHRPRLRLPTVTSKTNSAFKNISGSNTLHVKSAKASTLNKKYSKGKGSKCNNPEHQHPCSEFPNDGEIV